MMISLKKERNTGRRSKNPFANEAREYAQEALDCLVDIARNGNTDAARVSAANAILNRAFGPPSHAESGEEDAAPLTVVIRGILPPNFSSNAQNESGELYDEDPELARGIKIRGVKAAKLGDHAIP